MINAKKLISKILITAALTCIPFSTAFAVGPTDIQLRVDVYNPNFFQIFIPHAKVIEMLRRPIPTQFPNGVPVFRIEFSNIYLDIDALSLREADAAGQGAVFNFYFTPR